MVLASAVLAARDFGICYSTMRSLVLIVLGNLGIILDNAREVIVVEELSWTLDYLGEESYESYAGLYALLFPCNMKLYGLQFGLGKDLVFCYV